MGASTFGIFAAFEIRDGSSIAKIDGLARFTLQLLHEFRIQPGTGGNQRLQSMRYMGIATGDHASGGVGGFTGGFMLFNNEYAKASGLNAPRQRQPNDTAAEDDCIPTLHSAIVEQGLCRLAPNIGAIAT